MKLKLLKSLNLIAVAFVAPAICLNSCSNKPQDTQKINVTLDANGGTISKTKYELDKGTVFTDSLFEKPTKTDARFNKWVFADGSNIPDQYNFESDVTLKATYTDIVYVTVTLDPDGGTISSTTQKVEKDTTFSADLFPVPTKTGYYFQKWTLNGSDIPADYKISSNVTFKAKWSSVVQYATVTLDPNGGNIAQKVYSKIVIGSNYNDSLFNKPTKTGCTFLYWTYYKNGQWVQVTTSYVFAGDVTFKAQWENPPESITVTLDANGGTISQSSYSIEIGTAYSDSLFNKPTRSNYTFKYWSYLNNGQWVQITSSYVFNSDVTLKAQWESTDADQKYIDDLNYQSVCSNGLLLEASFDTYTLTTNSDYLQYCGFEGGMCSTFYKNGYVGRNFDWDYTNTPELVVHTPNKDGRYGSVGVALCYGFSSPSALTNTSNISKIKNIPNWTVDGVNDQGLCVSINEVPLDEQNIFNNGDGSSKTKINEIQLVRYLLDHASSVADAKDKIKNVNVIGISGANEMHLMLADASGKCAEIEFAQISNTTYKEPKFIMKGDTDSYFEDIVTNFSMNGYQGDCKMTTGSEWYLSTTSLSSRAEGCERYCLLYDKLINQNYNATSLDDVLDIMADTYYTRAYSIELADYSKTFWFSDFNYNGSGNTKASTHTKSQYQSARNYWTFDNDKWEAMTHSRTSKMYCTRNSSAYDLINKQLKIVFEEKIKINKVFKIDRSQE